MEKYAVDLSLIPPTDDQLSTIKKLGGELGMVKTASEADEIIRELQENE